MKYINYTTRENNIYCRRKRAVGSHTPWGERKSSGLSSYLIGERDLTAEDRKSAELPCGFTVAESWAALRKCWLGFYIRKSQGDTIWMAEYAKRIRKLQAEMGINPTKFDSNILDENTALLIDQSYRKSPTQLDGIQDGEQPTVESEEMDYEQIMAAPTINNENPPSPRQEIFTTRLSRRNNSCPSPGYQPHANSCYFGPPKPADQNLGHVEEIKTIYKKQRHAPPTNQDNFAVSASENTLAVPNPNRPPIKPILQGKSCRYQPPEDPPHTTYEDKSCEYEKTLAVPNPNRPPIKPILQGKSCRYQPPEDPPHTIYEDKSCPSDPQVNQMQGTKKEKTSQIKAKSCFYTSQD